MRYRNSGWATVHGGYGGGPTTINLDPDEYIYKIEGKEAHVISIMTLYSNKGRVFGPFGLGWYGTQFSASMNGGRLLWISTVHTGSSGYVNAVKGFFACQPEDL